MSTKRLFHLLLVTVLATFVAGCALEEKAEDENGKNDKEVTALSLPAKNDGYFQ